MYCPIYVYTDVPAVDHDATVETTPLHDLRKEKVLTDVVSMATHCDELTTDKQLTMLFEGQVLRHRLPSALVSNST